VLLPIVVRFHRVQPVLLFVVLAELGGGGRFRLRFNRLLAQLIETQLVLTLPLRPIYQHTYTRRVRQNTTSYEGRE